MPRIGFGTAGLGDITHEVVTNALSIGYRHFDSAQAQEWYREDLVGLALHEWKETYPEDKDSLYIVTKIHPRDFDHERGREAVLQSLRALGKIDLLLIHSPRCWEGMCS